MVAWVRSSALAELVAAWDVQIPRVGAASLFDWLDQFSEAHWDYRNGNERNLARQPALTPDQERVTVEVAAALGLTDPRAPLRSRYDAVLVLGGLLRACLTRPMYASALEKEGHVFGEIVALGGFRHLAGNEIPLSGSLNVPVRNEFEAMVHGVRIAFQISEQPDIELSSPHGEGNGDWAIATFRARPDVSVVAAPSSEPTRRRANSVDTYTWWANRHPTGISGHHVLVITSTIYVPYQEAGAISTLGLRYEAAVETVGVPAHFANLGSFTTMFTAANYLQEIRSAIRGYRQLFGQLEAV